MLNEYKEIDGDFKNIVKDELKEVVKLHLTELVNSLFSFNIDKW
jgi:hypothetical protein